jgi:hypothetical protein
MGARSLSEFGGHQGEERIVGLGPFTAVPRNANQVPQDLLRQPFVFVVPHTRGPSIRYSRSVTSREIIPETVIGINHFVPVRAGGCEFRFCAGV